jgi:hypothetical protein
MVGLMLSLAGLVGSFFNIQLSQWLRDLLALEQKADLNKFQNDEPSKKAIVECKIELAKLNSPHSYFVNLLVLLFVVFVLVNGLFMISTAAADPLYVHVNVALWVFLAFFVFVSAWLTCSGARAASRAKSAIERKSDV